MAKKRSEQPKSKIGGVTGKGFMPGTSGNPGGRSKGLESLSRAATKDGKLLITFWMAVLLGDTKTLKDQFNFSNGQFGVSLDDRIIASKLLAERGWGKPVQPIGVDEDSSALRIIVE